MPTQPRGNQTREAGFGIAVSGKGAGLEGMTSAFPQSAVRQLSNACRSAVDWAILKFEELTSLQESPPEPALLPSPSSPPGRAVARLHKRHTCHADRFHAFSLGSQRSRRTEESGMSADKVLVLNATGKVGRNVCRALLEAGSDVYGTTRSSNSPLTSQGVKPVVCNYTIRAELDRACEGEASHADFPAAIVSQGLAPHVPLLRGAKGSSRPTRSLQNDPA